MHDNKIGISQTTDVAFFIIFLKIKFYVKKSTIIMIDLGFEKQIEEVHIKLGEIFTCKYKNEGLGNPKEHTD